MHLTFVSKSEEKDNLTYGNISKEDQLKENISSKWPQQAIKVNHKSSSGYSSSSQKVHKINTTEPIKNDNVFRTKALVHENVSPDHSSGTNASNTESQNKQAHIKREEFIKKQKHWIDHILANALTNPRLFQKQYNDVCSHILNISTNVARTLLPMTVKELAQLRRDSLCRVKKVVSSEIQKEHSTAKSLFNAIIDTIFKGRLTYSGRTLSIGVDKDGYMYALEAKLKKTPLQNTISQDHEIKKNIANDRTRKTNLDLGLTSSPNSSSFLKHNQRTNTSAEPIKNNSLSKTATSNIISIATNNVKTSAIHVDKSKLNSDTRKNLIKKQMKVIDCIVAKALVNPYLSSKDYDDIYNQMLNIFTNIWHTMLEGAVFMTDAELGQLTGDLLPQVREIVLSEMQNRHATPQSLCNAIINMILKEDYLYSENTYSFEVGQNEHIYTLTSDINGTFRHEEFQCYRPEIVTYPESIEWLSYPYYDLRSNRNLNNGNAYIKNLGLIRRQNDNYRDQFLHRITTVVLTVAYEFLKGAFFTSDFSYGFHQNLPGETILEELLYDVGGW